MTMTEEITEEIADKALERVNALVAIGMDYKEAAWIIAIDLLLDASELAKAYESKEISNVQ
jgi:uncharacterized protein YoaH (UPF0181 family)